VIRTRTVVGYDQRMAEAVLWLLAAYAIIFVINLVPAFMPASWMVMAFFYIKFGLPLLILTIGGAVVSALGRWLLARASGSFRRRFMHDKESDLVELGRFLDRHRRITGPVTFAYTLTPLPTNNLFVAAGRVGVNMGWVLAGFTPGRILANTFWVWTTDRVFNSFGDVIATTIDGKWAIALQVVGAITVVLLFKVRWARWLRRLIERRPPSSTEAASQG
jgi:hypothetical protein